MIVAQNQAVLTSSLEEKLQPLLAELESACGGSQAAVVDAVSRRPDCWAWRSALWATMWRPCSGWGSQTPTWRSQWPGARGYFGTTSRQRSLAPSCATLRRSLVG